MQRERPVRQERKAHKDHRALLELLEPPVRLGRQERREPQAQRVRLAQQDHKVRPAQLVRPVEVRIKECGLMGKHTWQAMRS